MIMKRMAPFLIVIAGVLWGCLGIFVRRLNEAGLYSMEIVALRAFVTCIAMGIFVFFRDWTLFKIRFRDLWCFFGTGLCSIVFFNYCYFKAISMTSLSVAAILLYTAPAIVMVLSFVLFGERFSICKLISLVLTFAGCVLVTGVLTEPGSVTGSGILVGLGAGLGYALYSIFGRYAIERGYHSLTITFYTFLFASVGTLFLADISVICSVATKSVSVMGLCVALGIVCTVVPYLTYTLGLQYVENGRASILASVEPVTATMLGVVLYQEKISMTGIIGIVLVLAALILCNQTFFKKIT